MRHRAWSTQGFTLLEVLIAMTILSVLVLILLYFVTATQRLWQISASNARVYENSRVAFETLERDLRSAITSTVTDKQIGFYVNDAHNAAGVTGAADTSLLVTFVSTAELVDTAKSRLCEISYKHQTSLAAGDSARLIPRAYILGRQLTSDLDSSNWNFCGRPANWFINATANANRSNFEPVIDGVDSFTLSFYDSSDSPMTSDAIGNTTMPYRAEANLVLFDMNLVGQPSNVRFKTQRSFTKIFYLGDLQTN